MPEKSTGCDLLGGEILRSYDCGGSAHGDFFEIEVTSNLVTRSDASWICIRSYCHGLCPISCKNSELLRWTVLRDSRTKISIRKYQASLHLLAGTLPEVVEELPVKMKIDLGQLTHSAVS